jgi:tetratricopeptide (TPR) repeat protein
MIDLCEARGIPVVLCTVPSNVRDFAPIETTPYAGLTKPQVEWRLREAKKLFAEGKFEECLAACRKETGIEPRAAAFHYLAALALEKLGRMDEAADAYFAAKDNDAFPHRTTSTFNDKVREIAKRRGVLLFDAERAFRDASPHGIPGKGLFSDQCHPTKEGHEMIAEGVAALLAPVFRQRPE